jgi:hypothetical protein
MRYPTLGHARMVALVEVLLAGESVSVDAQADWVGVGESINLSPLEVTVQAASEDLQRIIESGKTSSDKEPFEGRLAAEIFPHLDALPLGVKDDPGFWRYLAVRYFWWFTIWREEEPIANGNVGTYIDAKKNTEQIPLRLYLRAKAVGGDSHLCQGIPQSADFWRSHVIRVRTGSAETLATAFARTQEKERMSTGPLRSYARRLNRHWTNVLLGMYDISESENLIQELRE